MVYDSDTRRKETVVNAAMKMLSEKAKLESSSECGVQIVFSDESDQYTITKSIKYTQTFDANEPWNIAPVVTEVMVTNLITHNTSIVYDINRQNEIIKERLISPTMLSYSLLQGEAIDNIVDLSNSANLAATVEALTDLSELKQIESTCKYLCTNSQKNLENKQKSCSQNKSEFEKAEADKLKIEKEIAKNQESISLYKNSLNWQLRKRQAQKPIWQIRRSELNIEKD